MGHMRIELLHRPHFELRDFAEGDRAAFLSCQMDPGYLALYDFDAADADRADRLFDLFLKWQSEDPRANFQLGLFERSGGGLCGNAGLRRSGADEAVLGIELCPDHWGRFRLALDVSATLVEFGFGSLGLRRITGDTSSGNSRVEKLARRFGAKISERRPGPQWMRERGWDEVTWELTRDDYRAAGAWARASSASA